MKFAIFFLIFMLMMSVYRIWETFFKKNEKEKGHIINKWTLPALSSVHFTVGIIAIIEYCIVERDINFFVTALGIFMFSFSFILRIWSIKTLGRYHSIHIEIRDHHPLIRKGPYKYLKHPYYLSLIFELLGLPLIPNTYFAFFISLFLYIPLVFIRLYLEEKAMIGKFGEEYLLYKREVSGLIPFKR